MQVAFSGRRSTEGERIMREIMSREWGLILLDEVSSYLQPRCSFLLKHRACGASLGCLLGIPVL